MTSPEFKTVEVQKRQFCCANCGTLDTYIIYPITTPEDGAIKIECDCSEVYWWSRKLEKLFNNATKQELCVEDHFSFLEKCSALQLVTPSEPTEFIK